MVISYALHGALRFIDFLQNFHPGRFGMHPHSKYVAMPVHGITASRKTFSLNSKEPTRLSGPPL